MREERLLNERRKLLYCSHCSVSQLMSAASGNDIVRILETVCLSKRVQPFGQEDLKELTFAGIQRDVRPQILVLYEWMRGCKLSAP